MNDIERFLTDWSNAERAGDITALDIGIADDFVGVGPLGFALPKTAWLARHQSGDLRHDTFELAELETRTHGDNAVATARIDSDGTFRGHPLPEALRATLVCVDVAGEWRLAGAHMSFIAGTPGAPPMPGGAHAPDDNDDDQRTPSSTE